MSDRFEILKETDLDVRAHAGLVRDVVEHLDLDQGLAEVFAIANAGVRAHAGLVRDVAEYLDLDQGLAEIRNPQPDSDGTTQFTAEQSHADRTVDEPPGKSAALSRRHRGGAAFADMLEIAPGMVVQEIGWDEDVDDDLSAAIEERIGADLLDEDTDEVVDVVLLWWREDDGNLIDALINAISRLADEGVIWILTPTTGHAGHVELSKIAAAARLAGLAQTSNRVMSADWSGIRLVSPKTVTSTLDSNLPSA